MAVHLIKLCVGIETVSELAAWQAYRLEEQRRAGQRPELAHITRNMPRREGEIIPGGSLYWVMKGKITVRQGLLELRPVDIEGVRHCALLLDAALVPVEPHPRRAFQGWRYLEAKDAPCDAGHRGDDTPSSRSLERELIALGVL